MKRVLFSIVLVLIIACNEDKKTIPDNFDFGEVSDGLYTNDFFDLEIRFNSVWTIQNKEQMNILLDRGKQLAFGSDKDFEKLYDIASVRTAYLLTITKYEVGAPVEFNPSFMVVAENIDDFPGIERGSDYLFHTKKILNQAQISYSFKKNVFEKQIKETVFDVMETQVEVMGKQITQDYVSTITKGFSLSFILSYTNEDEKKELYNILNEIKI